MSKVGSQARAWRREAFYCGEGGLREGEPAGKVCRGRVFLREPTAEPTKALGGVEKLTIEVNGGGTGGSRRIPLFGGAPMYKFGFRNTEGHPSLLGLSLN